MKYEYDGQQYDTDTDILFEIAVENSTNNDDGSHVCDICGEVFDSFSDLEMHIGYGHHFVKLIPTTEKEIRIHTTIEGISDDLSEEERFKEILKAFEHKLVE
jgi:protein subunit release factor A